MSRLSRRLLAPIAVAVVAVTVLSILLNSLFIWRYNLRRQNNVMDEVHRKAVAVPRQNGKDEFQELEQTYNVTIVTFPFTQDENAFNEQLRKLLKNRGIGFQKLWLWEDGFKSLEDGKTVTKLYNQERLQYSILVRYGLNGGQAYAVAMNIPHSAQTLRTVNAFTVAVFGAGGVLLLLFTALAVRRITRPVEELTALARDLSRQQFRTIEIHTRDELETLADSFNEMSDRLEKVQKELRVRNREMEELLSNVAHEVKTPVAVIKAYGQGIKDGIDDGGFLDEILKQNQKIDEMVEALLKLSRLQKTPPSLLEVSLSELATDMADSMAVLADGRGLPVSADIQPDITAAADRGDLNLALQNLFTNAVKYGYGYIRLSLRREDGVPVFRIANGVEDGSLPDFDRIWEPFYVGEQSRSKLLSGTGLGLALVKAVAKKYGYLAGCRKIGGGIEFYLRFG